MSPLEHIRSFTGKVWQWFQEAARKPYAEIALAAYSLVESMIPFPPADPFIVALILANNRGWMRTATVATLGSIAGAVLGYVIGYVAYDPIGRPLLAYFGAEDSFTAFQHLFNENSFLVIFAAALTPLPNIVIPAGFLSMDFPTFVFAWIVGRIMRFFGVAYVVYAYGTSSLNTFERYFNITTVIFALLVIGWLALRLLGL